MSFMSKFTKEFEGLKANFSSDKPSSSGGDSGGQRGYGEQSPPHQPDARFSGFFFCTATPKEPGNSQSGSKNEKGEKQLVS